MLFLFKAQVTHLACARVYLQGFDVCRQGIDEAVLMDGNETGIFDDFLVLIKIDFIIFRYAIVKTMEYLFLIGMGSIFQEAL